MKKSLMRNMVISLLFSALLGYAVFLFLQYGSVFSALIRNIILGCIAVLFICIWWIFIADALSARRHAEEEDDDYDEEEDDSEFYGALGAQGEKNAAERAKAPAAGLVMKPTAPAAPAAVPVAPVSDKTNFDLNTVLNLNDGTTPAAPAVEVSTVEAPAAQPPKAEALDDTKEVPARHLKARLNVPVVPFGSEPPAAAAPAEPVPAPAPAAPAAPDHTVVFQQSAPAAAPAPAADATRAFPPVQPAAPVKDVINEMATQTFTPPVPEKPQVNVDTIPFSSITPQLIASLSAEERNILTRRLLQEKKRRSELSASRKALDAQLDAAKARNAAAQAPSISPAAAAAVDRSNLYNTVRLDADLMALQPGTDAAAARAAQQKANEAAMMEAARRRAERIARERAEQEAMRRLEEERKAQEAIKRQEAAEEARRQAERQAAEELLRQKREQRAADEKNRREAEEAARVQSEQQAEERRREEIRLRQEVINRDYARRQREEAAQRESLRAAQLEAARTELEARLRAEDAEKDRNLRSIAAARMEVARLSSDVQRRERELNALQTEIDQRPAVGLSLQNADQAVTPAYLAEVHSDRALRDEKARMERELAVARKQLEAMQHQLELQRRREEAESKARDARIDQLKRWKTQQAAPADLADENPNPEY